MTPPQKKDLISLLDHSPDEIVGLLDSAEELKRTRGAANHRVLDGRTGVLIFEKPSLRTRTTFEVAIHELGGHPINLTSDMVQIGRRETVEDVARNLERWVHMVIARTYSHERVVRLAQACRIPVINALTDTFHPCQALAFALTLREHRGKQQKAKVVFVGDGNNVCNSLMAISAQLGYDFTLLCPAGYESPADIIKQARECASRTGAHVEVTDDAQGALRNATAVYTDVWASMGQEDEAEKRKKDFSGFQVNGELLSHAPSDALVSHCLPAHRGEEITSDVLDGENSIALDEAENRLHVQKAVIAHLLS